MTTPRPAAPPLPRTTLTADELAELRELVAALTEGDGITPGPWHPAEDGDRAAYGWWLDNEAGDSSFPGPSDVALFVNLLPRLLAEAARFRSALEIIAAKPDTAPDAIGVTARNIARAALESRP